LENADAFPGSLEAAAAASISRWQRLLEQPGHGDHIAQLYHVDDSLLEPVRRFLDSGLRAGDGIVVVATLTRWRTIRHRLARGSTNVDSAIGLGQLRFLGAHNVLLSWTRAGCTQAAFDESAGATVGAMQARYGAVRVFSDLADVLLKADDPPAAANVQGAWNAFLPGRPVALLSACRMDRRLDERANAARLQSLCVAQDRIIPDLRWLMQNMPRAAERVLAAAREPAQKPESNA